jgi:hypothetical protein
MRVSIGDVGGASWVFVALIVACGGSNRESRNIDPATVKVSKAEPPERCKLMGTVEARMDEDYELLRMSATYKEANYVVLDVAAATGGWGKSTKLTGRAFYCPDESETATPPETTPAPVPAPVSTPAPATTPAPHNVEEGTCSPACSTGYSCSAGGCIPVCEPPCAANEQCGPDRVCRLQR